MVAENNNGPDPIWKAFGPAKQKWKEAGNFYSHEELLQMQKDFADLTIQPIPRQIYDAN
jgi:hypothetical protein